MTGHVARAADVVRDKSIGMDLARDIANEAIQACRQDGYYLSAVAVDRHGLLRAASTGEARNQTRTAKPRGRKSADWAPS